ncbi:MAG: hypothetical protein N2313_06105 [Meiothermus ruber]|nr:hypothetical protein [Meiothermus ruber]
MSENKAGRKNELLRYWGFLDIALRNRNNLELTPKQQLSLVLLGVALEAYRSGKRQSFDVLGCNGLWYRIKKKGELDSILQALEAKRPQLKELLPENCRFSTRYGKKKERSLAKALKTCKLKPYEFRDLVAELSKKIGKTLRVSNFASCCPKPARAEAILALTPLLGALEALHDYLGEYEQICSGVRAQISALFYYLFLRGKNKAGCLKLATTFNVVDFLKTCGCLKESEAGTYGLKSAQRVLVIRKNNGKGQVCFGKDGYLLEVYAPNERDPDGEKLACPNLCAFFPDWYNAADKCFVSLPKALYPQGNAYDFDLVREYHNYLLGCLLDGKSANFSAK